MENVGFPRGLIRYDTENRLLGRASKVFRPRIIAYALLLAGFFGVFATALHRRLPFEADFMRAPGVLPYALLPDGRLSNQLNVQLANKSDLPKTFHTQLVSPLNTSIEIIMPGDPLTLAPRELKRVPVFINFPKSILEKGRRDIVLQVKSEEIGQTQSFVLMGPD
jgi:polyferredoxin